MMTEFIDAIVEAAHWGTGTYLRLLFTTLLLSDQFSRPDFVWNSTWQYLNDDITQRQRHRLRVQGKLFSKIYQCVCYILMFMVNHKFSLDLLY